MLRARSAKCLRGIAQRKQKMTNGIKRKPAGLVVGLFLMAMNLHPTAQARAQAATTARNGQHDFDFNVGTWKTHIRRLVHAANGADSWIEQNGTVVVQPIWNGRGELEQIEADGPTGHWEGLTLFLYNPQAHQWSESYANSKDGILDSPMVGQFNGGRGEFFAQVDAGGQTILVRGVWSDIQADSHRYTISLSSDGGATWDPNFIAELTRASANEPDSAAPSLGADAPEHGFDFELGTWKLHLKRLVNPLTGSHTWTDFYADSVTRSIWGGRGELEQFEASGAAGRIEGLTLRTYDPQTHQWRLYWANSKDGALFVPQIGQFKGDTGEFYGTDFVNGKYVYVRFIWWPMTAHFEQAFSNDGGKTWEVNWITDQTRVSDEANKTN
jgi:hypothetical protein